MENELNPRDHIVYIVDDDRRICESFSALLSTYDLNVVTFGSATEYIAYPKPDLPACLILDVELPDINGLDLQSQIRAGTSPANRVHHRPRRHSHVRARDQGRCGRLT